MPLPSGASTITGGCNCQRIRYRINVPRLEERPLHPNFDSNSKLSPVFQSFIFTDHCNDCRRATGSILPAWISGPLEYVEVSIREGEGKESSYYRPARSIFAGPSKYTQGKLSFYNSSPGKYRTFCTICGTNLTFWEETLPNMVDISLGTVDREYLEHLSPERHLWWDKALSWVKQYVDSGDGGRLERHVEAQMNNRYS